MSFKLKTKKISIIAGAITIMTSSFGSFAAGPSGESLPQQTMGISEVNDLTEQTSDDDTSFFSEVDSVSSDVEDEEMSTNSSSRTIRLKTPGNYRLIGADSVDSSLVSQDPNETVEIVKTNDSIVIRGDGVYNVTIDNVKLSNINADLDSAPFQIKQNANVNLTLKGNNILNNAISSNAGLYADETSTLTITESSEGSSLSVGGLYCGINAFKNLTIKGGNLTIVGINYGIRCKAIVIKGGKIKAVGGSGENSSGIYGWDNLTIEGGNVTASGKKYGINVKNIRVKDGEIKAIGGSGQNSVGIYGRDVTIKGGEVKAGGTDHGANIGIFIENSLNIEDGNIEASGSLYGLTGKNVIIAGGNIKANGDNIGIYGTDVTTIAGGNIKANGGSLGVDVNNMNMSAGKIEANKMRSTVNMTLDGGEILTNKLEGDGSSHSSKITINRGMLKANEIFGVDIELNDGEIFTRSIDGNIWDTNLFNSIFKNSNNFRTNDHGKITAYTSEHFDINGGSINGVPCISK